MRFQLPKLSPLQARFLVSLMATVTLILTYVLVAPYIYSEGSGSRYFAAYAAEIKREDHNHRWIHLDDVGHILARREGAVDLESQKESQEKIGVELSSRTQTKNSESPKVRFDDNYEADFLGLDRGITGRQALPDQPFELQLNQEIDIKLLSTGGVYPIILRNTTASLSTKLLGALEGMEQGKRVDESTNHVKKQADPQIHISVSTCSRPSSRENIPAPQITLYISTSPSNTKPGPNNGLEGQIVISSEKGLANHNLETNGNSIYLSVSAPKLSEDYTGEWRIKFGASNVRPMASYVSLGSSDFVSLVDSDSNSALFRADLSNSTLPKPDGPLPYTIYAFPADSDSTVEGLEHSVCGIQNAFAQLEAVKAETSTVGGPGDTLMEQMYLTGLKGGTKYQAFMVMTKMTAIAIGETDAETAVWNPLVFRTKSDGNCQLLYGLDFCTDVAYAVPGNSSTSKDIAQLRSFYDSYTKKYWENFERSLSQTACTTTNTSQYSLARNCGDCRRDYKNWLCAVSIPRCTDFSSPSTHTFLKARNVAAPFLNGTYLPNEEKDDTSRQLLHSNSSRNPEIDKEIKPGPYKEILPCIDLCHFIVQSCPAALGFGCPTHGRGLELSYFDPRGPEGEIEDDDGDRRRDADLSGSPSWKCNRLGDSVASGTTHLISSSGRLPFASLAVVFALATSLLVS